MHHKNTGNMENGKEKIGYPYTVPEGYFESFDKRLMEKLGLPEEDQPATGHNGRLSIFRRHGIHMAIAASLALAAAAWFVLRDNPQSASAEQLLAAVPQEELQAAAELETPELSDDEMADMVSYSDLDSLSKSVVPEPAAPVNAEAPAEKITEQKIEESVIPMQDEELDFDVWNTDLDE